MPSSIPTPYGNVEQVELERLRASFDTAVLQALVTQLDALRVDNFDADGLRALVLKLHAMLHTLLNGAPTAVPAQECALAECLSDIADELDDIDQVSANLRQVLRALDELPSRDDD